MAEDPSMPEAILPNGTAVPKYRHLEEGELLLWSISEFPNAEGLGLKQPVPKAFYLTQDELDFVHYLIPNYNKIFETLSNEYSQISLIDLNEYLGSIPASGIFNDGVLHTPDLSRSGIFSSDGLNLNRRGQALLANLLISHLETYFSADIPDINVNQFKGNEFRLGF